MAASLFVLPADQVLLQSATYQTITDLTTGQLIAGTRYLFEVCLFISATASTTGHAISVNFGGGTLGYLRYSWEIPLTATTTERGASSVPNHSQAASTSIASPGATSPIPTIMRGVIVPGSNGPLSVRLRPEDVDNAVTVQRGSWMTLVT